MVKDPFHILLMPSSNFSVIITVKYRVFILSNLFLCICMNLEKIYSMVMYELKKKIQMVSYQVSLSHLVKNIFWNLVPY